MAILTNYTVPAPVNPYAKDVDALIDAGQGAAYELTAPTKPAEGKRGSVATERVKFQNAAREAGYTARVTEDDEREDGTTRLVFILTEKRERVVKSKAENADAKPSKGADK